MEARILNEFRAIVGAPGLITEPEQLSTYECDGLTNVPSAAPSSAAANVHRSRCRQSCVSAIAKKSRSWPVVRALA